MHPRRGRRTGRVSGGGRLIDAFLETCSRDQRRIFVKRYCFFEPVGDIARECGVSESKVKSVLFRMRKKLKEYLVEGGFDV